MSKSKKDPRSIEDTIRVAFLQELYTSFVTDGYIDPRGKSDTDLKKEFWALARRFAAQKTIYGITIYHEDLLKEARQYVRKEREEMACLFYATWFEHWINNLVMTRGRHISLSNDETKIIVRDTSLRAKYNCLPTLLGLPRLSADHINAVTSAQESK